MPITFSTILSATSTSRAAADRAPRSSLGAEAQLLAERALDARSIGTACRNRECARRSYVDSCERRRAAPSQPDHSARTPGAPSSSRGDRDLPRRTRRRRLSALRRGSETRDRDVAAARARGLGRAAVLLAPARAICAQLGGHDVDAGGAARAAPMPRP